MVSGVRPIASRRSLALATVLVALAAGGCGQGSSSAGATGAAAAADGVELLYQAPPATLARTAATLRRRLAALGVDGATVARAGAGRVAVTVPDRATADRVKGTLAVRGRLAFYDWEANVLGAAGRPHPGDVAVTGGMSAGSVGAGTHARAVARRIAARHRGAAVVVQAEPAPRVAPGFFALAAHVALRGTDLRHARQARDAITGKSDVAFAFTRAGARRWRTLTRTIARRGQALIRPGESSLVVAQHFAIVLDGRLLSVPFLDPQFNPDGVDAADGSQISGAFTATRARGLAAVIASGPLPAALHLLAERER